MALHSAWQTAAERVYRDNCARRGGRGRRRTAARLRPLLDDLTPARDLLRLWPKLSVNQSGRGDRGSAVDPRARSLASRRCRLSAGAAQEATYPIIRAKDRFRSPQPAQPRRRELLLMPP